MKAILKAHALSIFSVIAVIALAFTFATITVKVPLLDVAKSRSVSGFDTLDISSLGLILIAGPILVAVMNYIKALTPYKGKLAIIIPIICILCVVYIFMRVKETGIVSEYGSISASPGFGLILAFLSYVAMIVAGAVEYHGYTLNKAGVEKLKRQGAEFVKKAETMSQKASDSDKEQEQKP
ncbi:MAG: hypothetical protein Q4E17_03335 [Synergistes sp.]|nr:hypothetical protein [Synergistes sp.]